jgi:hypothetical protein
MADEPIALATNLNKDEIVFPCHMSQKLDGIANRINVEADITRQGKSLVSIDHIKDIFKSLGIQKEWNFIGELYVPGVPFKTGGGIIRRKKADPRIKFMLYDVMNTGFPNDEFEKRLRYINSIYRHIESTYPNNPTITLPKHGKIVNDWDEVEAHYQYMIKEAGKKAYYPEGYVLRNLYGASTLWSQGKRTLGMQRFKGKPTADLRVVGVSEATANKHIKFLGEEFVPGEGLRAVGRIDVEFKGEISGIGPGKLTHKERRYYWENPEQLVNHIIECEYMRDDSYKGIREGTFQRVRDDKNEPDTELV